MIITEELLMAYADGELEGAEHATDRARIEAAMRTDPEVARRIENHRALRRQLGASFDRVLAEPVPDRLLAAVRGVGARQNGEPNVPTGTTTETSYTAPVSDLSAARAAKTESAERAAKARSSWGLPQWSAMAASLVLGAIIGHVALKSRELGPIASLDGHLVAQGNLAAALSNQLASTQATTAPVQIGTSFKSKDGTYCRTFVLHEGDSVGGLACRAGKDWNVNTLARAETTPGTNGGYRPAGSEMPAAVLNAVEAQIVGDPLDSSGEAQAKSSGWK